MPSRRPLAFALIALVACHGSAPVDETAPLEGEVHSPDDHASPCDESSLPSRSGENPGACPNPHDAFADSALPSDRDLAPNGPRPSADAGADPGNLDAASHVTPHADAGLAPHVDPQADAGPGRAPPAPPPDVDCSELTYANFGSEFIYTWCLSCHAKMEPLLTTHELIRSWSPAIVTATVETKRMPLGGGALYLRDPQRAQLARWLTCGAP